MTSINHKSPNSGAARRCARALALIVALASGIAAPHANAQVEPAARDLVRSMAEKIGSARTIQLTAKHTLDPRLGVGAKIERGPLEITVQRPNRFFAVQRAGDETREIAFDGKTLCLMHPEMKYHALAPLQAASIEQFADRVDENFGFRPPVAELLAADPAAQLFLHVTSAKVIGRESVGWTRCDRLHFEQPGMTTDLWIGVKDKLPRRYVLTFTDLPGKPTWEIRLTKWELNVPVDERLFSKRPAADSHKIQMLKSR